MRIDDLRGEFPPFILIKDKLYGLHVIEKIRKRGVDFYIPAHKLTKKGIVKKYKIVERQIPFGLIVIPYSYKFAETYIDVYKDKIIVVCFNEEDVLFYDGLFVGVKKFEIPDKKDLNLFLKIANYKENLKTILRENNGRTINKI